MCNKACIDFGEKVIDPEMDVADNIILEVGSYNVNGSLRKHCENSNSRLYIGVDIVSGPGVDMLCRIEDLQEKFGIETFDLVICTEVLEHVQDWREAVRNLKMVIIPFGSIVLTTRSQGFPLHGYPEDYWRFSFVDMQKIFSDFMIEYLQEDETEPGIFIKAKKPINFKPNNLHEIKIFSIISNCYE